MTSTPFPILVRGLGLALMLSSAGAHAYPERAVTLVAPFAPGGDADLAARNLQPLAQRVLGQSVIVVNRAGASGAIGSQSVRQAPPDGYTLLMSRVGSQVVLPALNPKAPYKPGDFTMLGLLELNPVACVVRSESPHRSLKDLTDALKARPGKLNYSTSGPGTILNLGPQLLFDALSLGKDAAVAVAYKGGGEAMTAVLSGEVDFSCGNLSSLVGNIKGGKLRALVVTTPERVKDLPDVPTAREAGVPALEAIIGWSAVVGPPGLPKAVIDRWSQLLQDAARDSSWIAATERAGSIPRVLSPAETERYIAEQAAIYDRLAKTLNLVIE